MRTNGRPLLLVLGPVMVAWAFVTAGPPSGLGAPPAGEARVARVSNYVQLLGPVGTPQRASVNDIVHQETIVQTGKDSHVELTFSDETVVRLAVNTAFDFKNGTRDLRGGSR